MGKLKYENVSYRIRSALFEVYNTLGPGFKESIYHKALAEELKNKGLKFNDKKRIQIKYKGKSVGIYEPDFIVEDKIIIEIKSVEIMTRVFEKQLYSYLKGTDYKVGILVPFQLNITNPIIDLLERDK